MARTQTEAADFPVFLALAKTTNCLSRAGAIPFFWSQECRQLEAKKSWKIINNVSQANNPDFGDPLYALSILLFCSSEGRPRV